MVGPGWPWLKPLSTGCILCTHLPLRGQAAGWGKLCTQVGQQRFRRVQIAHSLPVIPPTGRTRRSRVKAALGEPAKALPSAGALSYHPGPRAQKRKAARHSGQDHGPTVRLARLKSCCLLTSYVTLSKLFNFSELTLSHL